VRFVDLELLRHQLPELMKAWQDPDLHKVVVVDGVLRPTAKYEVMHCFPDVTWAGWDPISNTLQFGKRSCERIELFPPTLEALLHELNSSPVIKFLEELTQTEGLLPDPHLAGGGLHYMQHGGYLWPHADFLQATNPDLKRMINLVLYVHPTWTGEMGGNFERWEGRELVRRISPAPYSCVIFRTDGGSIHGVSQITGNCPRQSIALFYYSVVRKPDVSLDHTTAWSLDLKPPSAAIDRGKLFWASMLMRGSLCLKRGAKYLNKKAEQLVNAGR
jgi:hypothetical protein